MAIDRRGFNALALLFALACFAFVLHASYPGYLNGDSENLLMQAMTGKLGDWHSPFVVLLWSFLLLFFPGPSGFIIFNNLLIWASFAMLAIYLRAQVGNRAILIFLVPFFPGVFNYLGHVHIDAMLAAWLIAGFTLAYVSKSDSLPSGIRLILQILANLACLAAFMTRLNSIFALIPLLLYANSRLGLKKNMALAVLLLASMPIVYKIQNGLLGIPPSHPSDSIKTYHLLAWSYYEKKNLFPGNWTAGESKRIIESCYSPVQWDIAAPWGQCEFIGRKLHWQGLWGSHRLTITWATELAKRPLTAATMLFPIFKLSMFDPNSRPMLYRNPTIWNVSDDPPRWSTSLARDYIKSNFNDRLGRPWVFGLVASACIILLLRRKLHRQREGLLALAVLSSGLVYLLSYFFINVSAEFRYFYWAGFAAYIGAVLVLIAQHGEKDADARPIPDLPSSQASSSALVLATLTMTLLALPFELPSENRTIALTALEGGTVRIQGVHLASTPKWMNQPFQGKAHPMLWAYDASAYVSTVPGNPILFSLNVPYETVDIEFQTGPDRGKVTVDEPGHHMVVETGANEYGVKTIQLPAQVHKERGKGHFALKTIVTATLLFLALYYLLTLVTSRRSVRIR